MDIQAEDEDFGKLLKPQEPWSENQLNPTSLVTSLSQRKSSIIFTILVCAEEKQYGLKKQRMGIQEIWLQSPDLLLTGAHPQLLK